MVLRSHSKDPHPSPATSNSSISAKAEDEESKSDYGSSGGIVAPLRRRTIISYLNEPIREDLFLELQLLLLAFGTGIQDATTYPDYFCFASNQTGNTVLLAIGVSGIAPGAFSFSNIGVSLALFVFGGWVSGQIGNFFGPRRRIWLLVTSLIQTLMVWAAVAIQFAIPIHKSSPASLAVLALLAFSSSAQVAMARSLKITEITTAMATAAYVDLLIDPKLYAYSNRSRNRRVAFLFMLCGGSFAGAYVNRASNSATALLFAALLKTVASFGLFFNRPLDQGEFEEKSKEQVLMLG